MPQRSRHSAALRAAVVLVLALAVSTLSAARAGALEQDSSPPAPAKVSSYAPALKRLQQRLLLQGAQARIARAKTLARQLRRHPGQARPGARIRRPGDWSEAGGRQGAGAPAPLASLASPTVAAAGLAPDVIVNSRAQDSGAPPRVGQAEQMVAALGSNILVAWNDGFGFESVSPTLDTQGYGYSTNGGTSFTDGGVPPKLTGWDWSSDPLVVVNEKTSDFWYCALVNVNGTQNGIGLVKARFNAGTVQWFAPTLVRVSPNTELLFDKPWLVADSLSGRLYLSYTVFANRDTIVFQRSNVGGTAWDNPQRLSADLDAGFVQGSRPVVGPNGEVYVAWYTIGSVDADTMKVRKSTDQGATFNPAVDVSSLYANFGNGAPGFNRPSGVTYPSLAVDRSSGAHRGRIYMAWNESIDFYDDTLGVAGAVSETEANDSPATADSFTPGKIVRGSVSTTSDLDYFKFDGTAGQTEIFFTDSISAGLSMSLRLFCTDGTTRLALSAPGAGQQNIVVFTLPVTGTYYMRCASFDGATTGGYRIVTGLDKPTAGERARDHRDVFVTWSDGGTTWSTPVLASDSPPGFDDWLPEVAVAGDNADVRVGSGRPYCIWYDWRESASICGGGSHVYLARSDDNGGSWTPLGALTSVQTDWTSVQSDILPNQGDYLSLFANHANLYAAWADGRNGDPDIYATTVPLLTTPVEVALASVTAEPGRVSLTWYAGGQSGLAATVERRESTTDFAAIGQASSDGAGNLSFVDATVSPGGRYAYRIAWLDGTTQRTSGEVWVDVPVAATFALNGARPNPASHGVFVSLSLPDAVPARLELLDVAGRRLGERQVAGAGEHRVDVSEDLNLEPGVYLVRLTQGTRSLTTRVTVIR